MMIEHAGPTPLYRQVASIFRQQIESGTLKPGMALPPEEHLVQSHRVSRVTIRKALRLLVDEGLIVRQQGKGTFVRPVKIEEDMRSLRGFAEMMETKFPGQVMEVLDFGKVSADRQVAQALQLMEGQNVLRIRRRHTLDGNPIACAVIYLHSELESRITETEVAQEPIYPLLIRKVGVDIQRATQVIRALAADRELAKVLGISRASPVLSIERTTYSSSGDAVEYIVLYYPADRHVVTQELSR